MLSAIWAESDNGFIGKDGVLPWSSPRDLKYFKEKTLNTSIVMGRKTFDSLNNKCLPRRTNYVLTRNKTLQSKDAIILHNINDIHKIKDNIFIIGGSQLYKELINDYDFIYRTIVHTEVNGDTKAPSIPLDLYKKNSSIFYAKDKNNPFDLTFEIYTKKEN